MLHMCLALLLVRSVALGGTTGKLAGRVTDRQSGEAIVGANVVVKGTSSGCQHRYRRILLHHQCPAGELRRRCQLRRVHAHDLPQCHSGRPDDNARCADERRIGRPGRSRGGGANVSRSSAIRVPRCSARTPKNSPHCRSTPSPPCSSSRPAWSTPARFTSAAGARAKWGTTSTDTGWRIPLFNGAVLEVNNQAIQEMELLSGTFNAEYGNALSGVVNVVTKETAGPVPGESLVQADKARDRRDRATT